MNPDEPCVWPPEAVMQRRIREIKRRRARPYRERAAARRVIGLMHRDGAGEMGSISLGKDLDERLERLLL